MRVAMIGTGYVGLVTGTCFAATGNNVICVDVVKEKIDNLNKGIIPIFEPGLDKMVKSAQERGNLSFTTDIKEALQKSDICFIAVGTPMGEDGSADLQYVMNAARQIGKYMVHDMYIVVKNCMIIPSSVITKYVEPRLMKTSGVPARRRIMGVKGSISRMRAERVMHSVTVVESIVLILSPSPLP